MIVRDFRFKVVSCLVILCSLSVTAVLAAVPDYTLAFNYRFGSEWQNYYSSPLGAPNVYPSVASSSNTPRDVFSPHGGVDFGAARGSSAVSVGNGTVAVAGNGGDPVGNWVWVSLGAGLNAVYMHLDSISVSVGDYVAQGTEVGKVGSTGGNYDPHLHFTLRTSLNGSMNDNPWWYLRSACTGWNSVQDLDMFKSWYTSGGDGRFNITVYTRDSDISSSSIAPVGVTVFHRKAGETSWRSSPMVASANYQYYWNYTSDPNYSAYDTIQVIVRAQAGGKSGYVFDDDYTYAFAPGRYKKPAVDPNNWSSAPTQWFAIYR